LLWDFQGPVCARHWHSRAMHLPPLLVQRPDFHSHTRGGAHFRPLFPSSRQLQSAPAEKGSRNNLLQLRVLSFGLLQDGDVGIGALSEGEEVSVGGERTDAQGIAVHSAYARSTTRNCGRGSTADAISLRADGRQGRYRWSSCRGKGQSACRRVRSQTLPRRSRRNASIGVGDRVCFREGPGAGPKG